MRNAPIPLIGQFYADDAHPWSMQDVCNYLPAAAETEGTRTATKCTTPPGLAPYVETGSLSPVRGLYNANGRLFGVVGATFYEFSQTGVAIPRGTVGGASRVRMAHNQQSHGNEVVIVNGSSGYLYNTQTQVFAAISDDGYPGAIDVVFIDGYFVQIDPTRRFAFNSDLASGADYNTLDRFTSEVSPDPLVGLAAPQNELILFSETSAEFFSNEGAAQQPFRSKRISMKRGAASRYGQAELDNTVFWLGNDGKFYVLEGYAPKRISTRPIEQAIRGLNWAQAFAFVWESEGHAVVYWTFPDGQTWGYDASQGRWHRRASYGLDRWRVNNTAFWEDRWIAGDFQRGRLWELDWGYPWEYQTEFVSEIVAPVIHDNQNRVLMPRLEVLMDVGQPEVEVREFAAQPEGPTIEPMAEGAPAGTVGMPYNPPNGYQWEITQGDAPLIGVTLREGTIPPGMTMDAETGDITGTPTTAGSYPITVRVTDTNMLFDDAEDTISVFHPLFVQVQGSSNLLRSNDGGATWNAVDTGGSAVTEDALALGWRTGQISRQTSVAGRVSDDGTTWADCTVPGGTGFAMWNIWTGTEWLRRSAGGLQASADGITYATRTFPSIGGTIDVTARSVARRGEYIISTYKNATLNRVAWSGDVGATFSILTNTDLYTAMVSTSSRFLAFSGASGRVWFTDTGAEGTWTFTDDLIDTSNPVIAAAYSPTLDRVVAVTAFVGEAFTSDDDGETWEGPFEQDGFAGFSGHMIWAHDQFVLTATNAGNTASAIFTSPDGQVWTKRHEVAYSGTGYLTKIASI